MAFEGLLISRLNSVESISGVVINQSLLKANVNNVASLLGSTNSNPSLTATLRIGNSVVGYPAINGLDVLDVVDYFRTENNINF